MRLGRIAPVVAMTALVAAAAGVAAGPGAAAPTHAAKATRLVSFRSCGDLLGYTKAQAGRFVSPYGIGMPVAVSSVAGKGLTPSVATSAAAAAGAAGAAPSAARDATTPQEGIDYSGTNVQEQGV